LSTKLTEELPIPERREHLSEVVVNQDAVKHDVTPTYAVGLEAMYGGPKFVPMSVKLAEPLAGAFTGNRNVIAAES
jgi:hypothetical protein